MKAQGRKEIGEAVLIAGLSALVSGLVNWGIERLKANVAERQAARRKQSDVKTETEESAPDAP